MKKLHCLLMAMLLMSSALKASDCEFEEIDPQWCEEQRQQKIDDLIRNSYRYSYNGMNLSTDSSQNGEFSDMSPPAYSPVSYEGIRIPTNITPVELTVMLGLATSAVVFFNNDQEVSDFVSQNSNEFTEVLSWAGEKVGRAELLGVGGYVLGLVIKNGEVKSTSLMILKATMASGFITRILKTSFGRERPNRNNGPDVYHGLTLDHHSFPSGHTTSAFAFATVIAETYKDKSKLIPVLAYGAAAIGAWSRVHDRAHWASDVAIGALIGHFTTKFLYFKKDKPKKHEFAIYPMHSRDPVTGESFYGVQFEYRGRAKKDRSAERYFDQCEDEGFSKSECTSAYLQASWRE